MAKDDCEHKFVYGGVRYKDEGQAPGSGAHIFSYWEYYFCEKCMKVQLFELPGRTNSYQPIMYDASPLREGL